MSSDENDRARGHEARGERGPDEARVITLRPGPHGDATGPAAEPAPGGEAGREAREPLWRHLVGGVLRRERVAQQRTLKEVAEAARISMPYLSEVERGRKEASSEVLAAAAHALGLGLGDLLMRVQRELSPPARRVRAAGVSRRDARVPGTDTRSSSGVRPAAPRQGDVRLAA